MLINFLLNELKSNFWQIPQTGKLRVIARGVRAPSTLHLTRACTFKLFTPTIFRLGAPVNVRFNTVQITRAVNIRRSKGYYLVHVGCSADQG